MGRWHGSGVRALEGFSWSGTPRQQMKAKKRLEAEERSAAAQPCDHGLLPLGDAPVAVCTKPGGHDGLHQTARGVAWADPADDEDI